MTAPDATRPVLPDSAYPLLPPDDALRVTLHDEVHVRPAAQVRLPALIIYVAVLNDGISREQELEHLRRLPGQGELQLEDLRHSFLRLRFANHILKWERHTEFTRYTLVQPLPPGVSLEQPPADLLSSPAIAPSWLRAIPGQTVAAIELAMVHGGLPTPEAMAQAQAWFGGRNVVASHMGSGPQGHSWVMTQLRIGSNGFERILVVAPPDTRSTRGGRISQRLLELETYRLMALRGLPAAKRLGPTLGEAERELAEIAAQMENESASDESLLHRLVALAARVERATAENVYRFAATRSYATLVGERITELRETPIPGTPTISAFMQRRFSPAMVTVQSAAQRLTSLSERVARTSALLRTRVDIATEVQNRQLLEKLTKGQELQLQLQSTVEGLSIAAISYYVVSLLLYGGKALKGAGVPLNPEVTAGALIPLVLWGVWRTVQRIHAKLHTH